MFICTHTVELKYVCSPGLGECYSCARVQLIQTLGLFVGLPTLKVLQSYKFSSRIIGCDYRECKLGLTCLPLRDPNLRLCD